MSLLIAFDKKKARHFHPTALFINDLFAINDSEELSMSFCDIYIPRDIMLRFRIWI